MDYEKERQEAIIAGERALDSLYEACEPMAEFLKSRGVEVRCRIYGSPEAQEVRHVFHVNMYLQEGERANRDQTAFFKEHIR